MSYRSQNLLSQIKNKTGLTPNIVGRFAICISLNDPSSPNLDVKNAHSSIRVGLGRFNTENEIDYFISKIIGVINMLKNMEYWSKH